MWGSTVELLPYPLINDRGRLVPDLSQDPTPVPIRGVDLQPGASTELVAQRSDSTAVRWTVFVPPSSIPAGHSITEDSIIRVLGAEVCQVDGRPLAWIDGSPLDHYVVALVAWEPQ